MNKYGIKILNTIYVIIRPTKEFIFPNLARRLEKLPTPDLKLLSKNLMLQFLTKNLHFRLPKFSVGDLVFARNYATGSKWLPAKVISNLSNVLYCVRTDRGI